MCTNPLLNHSINMPIQLIHSTDIDQNKWNTLVLSSPMSSVFGMSWYLDTAFSSWSALVLDDYQAGMLLPLRRKLGVKYAYNPLFVRETGVFSSMRLTNDLLMLFSKAIKAAANSIEIYTFQPLPSFNTHERLSQWRDLPDDSRQLLSSYNENTRRNIKKSLQSFHTITYDQDYDTICLMFEMHKLKEIDNLTREDIIVLREIMKQAVAIRQGFAAKLLHQDKCIASGFFITHNDTLLFLKGSASEEGKQTGAMHRLLHEVFSSYCSKLSRVDFGGSNIASVARFYKGLGGVDKPYYACRTSFHLF